MGNQLSKVTIDHLRERAMFPQITYLCCDCARYLGGYWPEGHVATCHSGECSVCKQKASLAHHFDWNLDENGQQISSNRPLFD